MKMLIWIVALLIIAAGGYYFFMMQPSEAPTTETQNGTASQKIDINAICEGALAYMSFPSGAEAEAWVEACKRGEHPAAIEQWKEMNGITDDRAI